MYTSVEITLNGKSGEPLSFRYDYDNEIVAQIILPQDCAETCTNIQDLMVAIDSGVICDGDESWTLRKIIEDFHNEEEEERYDLDNHLEEYDKFVQNALSRFKNFSNLKSVVIEVFGIEGWSDAEALDKRELVF